METEDAEVPEVREIEHLDQLVLVADEEHNLDRIPIEEIFKLMRALF